jgi:hypothetical protein
MTRLRTALAVIAVGLGVAALPVQVPATMKGKKGDRNIHLARVNGQLTYFIDCGDPLMRQ